MVEGFEVGFVCMFCFYFFCFGFIFVFKTGFKLAKKARD